MTFKEVIMKQHKNHKKRLKHLLITFLKALTSISNEVINHTISYLMTNIAFMPIYIAYPFASRFCVFFCAATRSQFYYRYFSLHFHFIFWGGHCSEVLIYVQYM